MALYNNVVVALVDISCCSSQRCSNTSGVFRNLKMGCPGVYSGVHFQKCSNFNIIFVHIKYQHKIFITYKMEAEVYLGGLNVK